MAEPKNSFVLYLDQLKHINKLSDEQAGKLIKGIYQYETSDKMPCFDDPLVDIVFGFISDQLERDRIKYEEKCSQNRENGCKGGRPRKANGFQENPKKANGFEEKPKKADTDTEHATDNDNVTDSDTDDVAVDDAANILIPPAELTLTPMPTKSKRSSPFVKPTRKEIKQFCADNDYNIDADYFYDYYESNGWKVGKNPMKDWQATVRNWARREKERPKPASDKSDSKRELFQRLYKEAEENDRKRNS